MPHRYHIRPPLAAITSDSSRFGTSRSSQCRPACWPDKPKALWKSAPARRDRPRHHSQSAGLLFEEPLSNLDAPLRCTSNELHAKLGATMIYVAQDQVEALTMADKIVVLNGGKSNGLAAHDALQQACNAFRRRVQRGTEDELLQWRACCERDGEAPAQQGRHLKAEDLPEPVGLTPRMDLPASAARMIGSCPFREMGDTEQAQHRAEIHVGFERSRIPVEPAGKTHCPALDCPSCQPSGEVRVMCCMAAVAEHDQARQFIGAAHRSLQEVMKVSITRSQLRQARNALVSIPRKHKAARVFPMSHEAKLVVGCRAASLKDSR